MKFISKSISFTSAFRVTLLCFIIGLVFSIRSNAQPIPIGDIRDTQYRTLQLLSDSTSQLSLSNRPLWSSAYYDLFKQNNFDPQTWWGKPVDNPEISLTLFGDYDLTIGAYEPVVSSTYNSKLPYGENNGAAWYGKGLTTEFKAGFYATSDYFTVTLRPHLFHVENEAFDPPAFLPTYSNGDIRYVEPGRIPEDSLAERIDRPWRFGPDPYTTLDWGQSSIRVHYNSIEAGISNETLWWGPGNRYALAMSNNAAGLPHAFIGTRTPIHLPYNIGDLQFRWIFARPQDSQFFDLDPYGDSGPDSRRRKLNLLEKKRFMNGLNIVYSPSFLPNLSIGMSRIIHQYVPEDGLSISDDLLGVFKAYPKPDDEVYTNPNDDSYYEDKNPITSVFFRWLFAESNAEFYGELYKGDHNVSLRDFLMEPQHGRGYSLGLQKILEFDGIVDFVKVNAEFNSLLPGRIDDVRPQTYYYTHHTVKQGHTNRGEVLGAAIGPGSESQYLGADGYFKNGKLGFFVQRVAINNHFHYEWLQRFFPLGGFKDQIHHRVNLNVGINGSYKLSSFLLSGKVTWNRNFNYGRYELGEPGFYTVPIDILDNFQYQLSVRYLF